MNDAAIEFRQAKRGTEQAGTRDLIVDDGRGLNVVPDAASANLRVVLEPRVAELVTIDQHGGGE